MCRCCLFCFRVSPPPLWQSAFARRWAAPAGPGPLPAAAVDDLLLKIEAALDMPATPEWQAARRQLRLRAMKDALEGRSPPAQGQAAHADLLAAVLRQGSTSAEQRARLQAVVAALRQALPGALTGLLGDG